MCKIFINTFLTLDQLCHTWKFFYRNKITLSSPSYFWICVFEGNPFHAILPSLEQLFTKKILSKSKSFYYSWECFEIRSFHSPTKCFPRLKGYINILYLTTIFLEGLLFQGNIKKLKKQGLGEQCFPGTHLLASVSTDKSFLVMCTLYQMAIVYFCFPNTHKCLYVLNMM